jgi:uncharacterized membrane protein
MAVNCTVWSSVSVVVAGVTLTATGGIRVIDAVAALGGTPEFVAVIVTVCWAALLAGAV